MRAAILGTGAVGGFLAALFTRAGIAVECLDRAERVQAILENGITVESKTFGNFTVRPSARETLERAPDIIFITVKANFVRDALERIDPAFAGDTLIIPLMNGLSHIALLKLRYGARAIAGTIGALEVFEERPGVISHTSQGANVELASDNPLIQERLGAVAELIRSIGIEAKVLGSEAEVVWRKFVRLNAIACATAATDKPIGALRSDPLWRAKIEGAVREAIAVAARESVALNERDVLAGIDGVHADQMSSLQRDVSAGRPSEVDAIPGAILEKCRTYGIPCPAISELYALIKVRERK